MIGNANADGGATTEQVQEQMCNVQACRHIRGYLIFVVFSTFWSPGGHIIAAYWLGRLMWPFIIQT